MSNLKHRVYKDLTTPEEKDWLKVDSKGKWYVSPIEYNEDRNFWGLKSKTSKEGLYVNPDLFKAMSDDDVLAEIPFEKLKSVEKLYGKLTNMSVISPVRNLNWEFFRFLDCSIFTPAANAFKRSKANLKGSLEKPRYTHYLPGTKNFENFWDEEFRRWKFGYEPVIDGKPCGIRISGEFYFYLNYSLMTMPIQQENGTIINTETFPNFMAMDYYWFRELEARENPHYYGLDESYKKSISCTKTRRAGFSYKEAAGCCWIILTENKARVAIASAPGVDKTDAALAAKKCFPILDHITNFTPFGISDLGDPKYNGGWKNEVHQDTSTLVEIRLGYFNTKTKEKAGRQSSIVTIALSKDDAAAGEGLRRVYFEEAGKIGNLAKAWTFTLQSLKAGNLLRGIGIIFGTGGSMLSTSGKEGTSRAFSTIHYNPDAAEIASFSNIYEYKEMPNARSGYFVSSLWCHFGSYIYIDGKRYEGVDVNGNSYFWVTELALNKERKEKMPPKDTTKNYNDYLTQKPITASEAFLITQGSIFQTADLIARQNAIRTSTNGFEGLRTAGELEMINGRVNFIPDLANKLTPITTMNEDFSNKEGCLLLYEKPQLIHNQVPSDAYIITVDPIGQDTTTGKSFSSIQVIKSPFYYDAFGPRPIVATYFGRHSEQPLNNLHDLLLKLSKFYNAKITYETDNSGGQILPFFTQKQELTRLLSTPDRTMASNMIGKGSKTSARKYGHTMGHDVHKSTGERLLYEWLGSVVPMKGVVLDANGVEIPEADLKVRIIDLLEDEMLIEQLIVYNRQGNYDAVLSLMGGIVQMKEIFSFEPVVREDDPSDISSQLLTYYGKKVSGQKQTGGRSYGTQQVDSKVVEGRNYIGSGSASALDNNGIIMPKQTGQRPHWLNAVIDSEGEFQA
jgi:hypothetical protein